MSHATFRARVLRGLAILPFALALAATPAVAHGGDEVDLGLTITITDASVRRDGSATVSGAIGCAADLHGVYVSAGIIQPVGRLHSIHGWGSTSVDCHAPDGAPFTINVLPDNGRFGSGQAFVDGWTDFYECTIDSELGEICVSDSAAIGPLSLKLHR